MQKSKRKRHQCDKTTCKKNNIVEGLSDDFLNAINNYWNKRSHNTRNNVSHETLNFIFNDFKNFS